MQNNLKLILGSIAGASVMAGFMFVPSWYGPASTEYILYGMLCSIAMTLTVLKV